MNEAETHLYHREGEYIPRVAAVHDLCGYGKCSLGVAIPVLSAAGCDVCPVPTGLFSVAHRLPRLVHARHDRHPGRLPGRLEGHRRRDRRRVLRLLGAARAGGPHPRPLRDVPERAARGRSRDGRPRQGVPHLHARAVRRHGRPGLRRRHPHAEPHRGGHHPRRAHRRGLGRYRHRRRRGDAHGRRPLAKGAKNVVLKGIQREGERASATSWGRGLRARSKRRTNTCPTCSTARATCTRVLLAAVMAGRSLAGGGHFAGELTCTTP